MALLEHRPRAATVVVELPVVLAAFGTKELAKLLDERPKAKEQVLRLLGDRLTSDVERRSSDARPFAPGVPVPSKPSRGREPACASPSPPITPASNSRP